MSGSERRGKRAEREERRDKREESRQTPRGRERSPYEAAREEPTLSDTVPPRQNPSRICSRHGLALSASSGGMAERSEKGEERRGRRSKGRLHDSLHIDGGSAAGGIRAET